MVKHFLLAILILLHILYGYTIDIRSVAYSYFEDDIYSSFVNKFNKYSIENNLNITLTLNLFTPSNFSANTVDYGDLLETILKRKNRKYDIYFFEYMYNNRYGPYFIDLKEYLPKEHIDLYSTGFAPEIGTFENKLVSLPIIINYSVLYSNTKLLEKYNKPVPETWDELIDTSKYIMEKEKEIDPELISFNGLFDDSEMGTCSLFEYIYSCRDSIDSPFPSFNNDTVANAFKYLKDMKEKIASNEQFKESTLYTLEKLNDGKALFVKYWNITPNPVYKKSIIPGIKRGISGSTIGGESIGIGSDIGDKKINASIKILEYITSKEFRKNFTLETREYSTIPSLYDDDDICEVVDCEFMKSIQFVPRKFPPEYSYDEYSRKFRSYIYKFLYGDTPIREALNEFDYLNKFYSITISDTVGKYYAFILLFIVAIMIGSLVLPLKSDFRKYYRILYPDFWIFSIFGTFLMLGSCHVGFGSVTVIKCHLRVLFFSFGVSFNIVPYICMLSKSIHLKNKLWKKIKRNSYFILACVLLIDNLLYWLILMNPFTISKKMTKSGRNYERCRAVVGINVIAFYIIMIFESLIVITTLYLAYIKRNDEHLKNDLRFLIISLYTTLLSIILIVLMDIVNINDYVTKFILFEVFYTVLSTSNHFIFFVIRPIWLYNKKVDEDHEYMKAFRSSAIVVLNSSNQKTNSRASNSQYVKSSIINNHSNTNIQLNP